MCFFIFAVLPKDADAEAVKANFRAHGRICVEAGGLSDGLRAGLAPGERLFHTTPVHCDCGTPLGQAASPGRDPAKAAEAMVARLRRKGWSEAKIARVRRSRSRQEHGRRARVANRRPRRWRNGWR